jgi:dynein heavy chain, axonemal
VSCECVLQGFPISQWQDLNAKHVQALDVIRQQAGIAEHARKKAADLKAGMDIFSIPQPPYNELSSIESDVMHLKSIWSAIDEWEETYDGWKSSKFRDINVWLPN